MSKLPVFTAADLVAQPRLDVVSLTKDDAVDLGLLAVELVRERELNLAVRVELGGETVFLAKTGTTDAGNEVWLEAKAQVVRRFAEPSLLVRRRHEEMGTPFEERADIDHERLKAHGGSVPLMVRGEVVGTLTTSGEPDVIDHAVSAEAVRRYMSLRRS